MSIRIAGQVVASAGSLTAHNEDPNAHPDIRELIAQGGGGGSSGSADVAKAVENKNVADTATQPIYHWIGTKAEHEAQNIAAEHPEWIAYITDDDSTSGGECGDGYSKEEIDNKFTVVDAAILGNADAIQKTRSDFMDSDSELQQQINAHSTEITTVKQDLGDLGEQVANIESKIPEGTSDTNPLINKQQLSEAIQGGGGGASVPDNVYTQDNLIAGKNVEIIDEPVKSDIDEDTMLAMHFDGDLVDNSPYSENFAMDSNIWGSSEVFAEFGEGKFGKCLTKLTEDTADNPPIFINPIFQTINDEFTVEYWQHITVGKNDSPAAVILLNNSLGKNVSLQVYYYKGIRADLSVNNSSNNISSSLSDLTTGWHHFVLTGKTNKFLKVYADGELKHTETSEISDFQNGFTHIQFGHSLYYMDEVRISRKILYTGDTYEVPTKPYSKGEPTGRKVINNTLSKTSELENDSGFLTGLPDGVFTKDTLLGGKDIEIVPEPVEGGIDEHTLACWHFDGNETDEVSEIEYLAGSVNSSYMKFGNGCLFNSNNAGFNISSIPYSSGNDISFDCWCILFSSSSASKIGLVDSSSYYPFMYFYASGSIISARIRGTSSDGDIEVSEGVWHHLYAHYIAKENKYEMFVDGKKIASKIVATAFAGRTSYCFGRYIDELRISDCVRWTEDFAPPTQPYRVAKPTGNMVVNFVGERLQKGADYVVESYNDGANWYRVYKSGWVEQGGSANTSATITLLKPMKDTNYTVIGVQNGTTNPSTQEGSPRAGVISSTQVFVVGGASWQSVNYYVCGQGA